MKHLCDIVSENGDIRFKINDAHFLDDLQLVKLLETECNPYTTNDNSGMVVYVSKTKIKYIFNTSLGNGGETAFDNYGSRVMDLDKLPAALKNICAPFLEGDSSGAINYISKQDYEAAINAISKQCYN